MLYIFIPASVFVFVWWNDYQFSKDIEDKRSIRILLIGLLSSVLIVVAPIYWANNLFSESTFNLLDWVSLPNFYFGASIIISGLISLCWYFFISWLDIYEREKFIYLFITFALACASTFLVFEITPFWNWLGLVENGNFINDFLYCTLRIGATEELVKILPVIILLKFTKQINEPFDYILFGATAALGFAFIENILYLEKSQLSAVNGRVFYASVSHMFDTGLICYFLAMAKYRNRSMLVAGIIGFVLASLAHGFYDFWLIFEIDFGNELGTNTFSLITILFFLVSIQLFAVMKNNLMNISQFYDPDTKLDVIFNKTRLFNILLVVLFTSYVAFVLAQGVVRANTFIIDALYSYTFIFVYLILSFNSTNIVHGYIAKLTNPKYVFLPLNNRMPDLLGMEVQMTAPKSGNYFLNEVLPLEGILRKRIALEGDVNWYVFEPKSTNALPLERGTIAVKMASSNHAIFLNKKQLFRLIYITEGLDGKVDFMRRHFRKKGNVMLYKTL